jgi:phosphoglycolate phosphatase
MPLPFPRPFAAVVFDLDGTLIDSAPDIAAALNTILAEENLPPFPVGEATRFIGRGAEMLIADAFTARGRALTEPASQDLTERYLATYAQRGSPDTRLYPGVRGLLDQLTVPMAVCTNKSERISRDVIAQFGLTDQFRAIIGSDSGFGRKPAPEPLVAACRALGARPADVLMVGDTVTDVATARSAGCAVAVVAHGYSQRPVADLGADAVLDSVTSLADLMVAA